MRINAYTNFSKRSNSTKRPSGVSYGMNVTLKENTSKESPVFILTIPDEDWTFPFNYIQWNDHYYFVDDVVLMSNHTYEVHCTQDVLATYKTEIGNYSAYIERADSEYNEFMNDSYISETQMIVNHDVKKTLIDGVNTDGCYIMRVVGETGLNDFVLSETQLVNVLSFMYNEDGGIFGTITDEATKVMFNPFQYIVSLKWFPFSTTKLASITERRIKLGYWDSGLNANLALPVVQIAFNIGKPTSVYTDFRQYNPNWTDASIYLPAVGKLALNPQDLQNDIHCSLVLDTATGGVQYYLTNDNGSLNMDDKTTILTASGQLSAEIQLGQLAFNAQGIFNSLSSLVGGVASLATGNMIAGVGGVIQGALTGLTAVNQPTESVNGGFGNRAVLSVHNAIELSIKQYGSGAIPSTVGGRPLYQTRQIKTLSGFIKCGNASIELSGFSSDRDAVNSYLNNGFYYE